MYASQDGLDLGKAVGLGNWNRVVTECLERAEGILGKESRGNGVQGETVHRNESEAGWRLGSLGGASSLGGCLMSPLLSQISFILTVQGVHVQQNQPCTG